MRQAITFAIILFACTAHAQTAKSYPVTGLVVSIDAPHNSFIASCKNIPGYMDAMEMPFSVHDAAALNTLKPGLMIDFTLVVKKNDSYAQNIRIRSYQTFEQEPMLARRLGLMEKLSATERVHALAVGQTVPDFSLIDQNHQNIRLSDFSGKVVALTFIYTSCPLPNYCFRLSSNFGRLNIRFRKRMSKDLVLLSVTFDPVHDQPEVLAKYSENWAGDKTGWHFLTGHSTDIHNLSSMFGLNFWPDEGTVTHSLHTYVINRNGKLAADLEGNNFTAQQLGDFIESLLK